MMDLEALKRKTREAAAEKYIERVMAGHSLTDDDFRSTLEVEIGEAYEQAWDDAVRELQPELTRLREIEQRVLSATGIARAFLGLPGEAPPVVSPTEEPTQ